MEMNCSLSDYRARPHTTNMNFKGVMVRQLVQSIAKWQPDSTPALATPEDQALQFYVTNAAFAALAQKVEEHQPLTEIQQWLMNQYYAGMTDIGLRAFFYTFLICTREARHGGYSQLAATAKPTYGDISFFKAIPDDPNAIMAHLAGASFPDTYTLAQFTDLLVLSFEKATYGGGYGGMNWARVARPLRDFVHGEITMEMFLDTVWTLAHNNGAIFNKGMMYKKQNDSELLKILDVQRSGQIPNMIGNKESTFVKAHHTNFLVEAQAELADFGVAKVDWQKVVDLGAIGSYGLTKSKNSAAAKAEAEKAAAKEAIKAAANAKKFQVTAGEWVIKLTRAELGQ